MYIHTCITVPGLPNAHYYRWLSLAYTIWSLDEMHILPCMSYVQRTDRDLFESGTSIKFSWWRLRWDLYYTLSGLGYAFPYTYILFSNLCFHFFWRSRYPLDIRFSFGVSSSGDLWHKINLFNKNYCTYFVAKLYWQQLGITPLGNEEFWKKIKLYDQLFISLPIHIHKFSKKIGL